MDWQIQAVTWQIWLVGWPIVQVGLAEGMEEPFEGSWSKNPPLETGNSCQQQTDDSSKSSCVDMNDGGSTMHMLVEASSKEPLE